MQSASSCLSFYSCVLQSSRRPCSSKFVRESRHCCGIWHYLAFHLRGGHEMTFSDCGFLRLMLHYLLGLASVSFQASQAFTSSIATCQSWSSPFNRSYLDVHLTALVWDFFHHLELSNWMAVYRAGREIEAHYLEQHSESRNVSSQTTSAITTTIPWQLW